MKSFAALAIVLASIIVYLALALGAGLYQRYPWPHFVVAAAGCAWLIWLSVQRRGAWRRIASGLGILFTSLFLWYTLGYSTYASADPGGSEIAADTMIEPLRGLQLPNQRGEATPVLVDAERARATLLVFYRGFW